MKAAKWSATFTVSLAASISMLTLSILLSACGYESQSTASTADAAIVSISARQTGYFKQDYQGIRQRILAYEIPPSTSKDAVLSHAAQQPYTKGGVTVVFYYFPGTGKNPTALKRFDRAMDLLNESGWVYRYQRSLNGSETFRKRDEYGTDK